jgi:hypothetical protein
VGPFTWAQMVNIAASDAPPIDGESWVRRSPHLAPTTRPQHAHSIPTARPPHAHHVPPRATSCDRSPFDEVLQPPSSRRLARQVFMEGMDEWVTAGEVDGLLPPPATAAPAATSHDAAPPLAAATSPQQAAAAAAHEAAVAAQHVALACGTAAAAEAAAAAEMTAVTTALLASASPPLSAVSAARVAVAARLTSPPPPTPSSPPQHISRASSLPLPWGNPRHSISQLHSLPKSALNGHSERPHALPLADIMSFDKSKQLRQVPLKSRFARFRQSIGGRRPRSRSMNGATSPPGALPGTTEQMGDIASVLARAIMRRRRGSMLDESERSKRLERSSRGDDRMGRSSRFDRSMRPSGAESCYESCRSDADGDWDTSP